MPDAQSLSALQSTLRELAIGDLAAALLHLKDQLPETAAKQTELLSILGRLNDANRGFRKGILSADALQLETNRVRDAFLELLNGLELADFEASVSKNSHAGPKTGTVLYRIPHKMETFKTVKCLVRVAIDEEVITDNMTVDSNVQFRPKVEVSDAMDAVLLDPSNGDNFEITSTSSTRQRVRDTGYTEWLFYVTPLKEGTHPLLIRVSMLEEVPGLGFVPKEVSLEETIQVIAELPANEPEPPLKPAGASFHLLSGTGNGANTGPAGSRGLEGATAGEAPPEETPVLPSAPGAPITTPVLPAPAIKKPKASETIPPQKSKPHSPTPAPVIQPGKPLFDLEEIINAHKPDYAPVFQSAPAQGSEKSGLPAVAWIVLLVLLAAALLYWIFA